jgi:hypothetical protein
MGDESTLVTSFPMRQSGRMGRRADKRDWIMSYLPTLSY